MCNMDNKKNEYGQLKINQNRQYRNVLYRLFKVLIKLDNTDLTSHNHIISKTVLNIIQYIIFLNNLVTFIILLLTERCSNAKFRKIMTIPQKSYIV